jgi:hypothetical protein
LAAQVLGVPEQLGDFSWFSAAAPAVRNAFEIVVA